MIYLDNNYPKIEDYIKENKLVFKSIELDSSIVRIIFENDEILEIKYEEYEGLNIILKKGI